MSYPGKRTEREILATPAAEVVPLWGSPDGPAPVNTLYHGDNLPVLAHLLTRPDVRGQVRLVYIDPPYATGGVFESRCQNGLTATP